MESSNPELTYDCRLFRVYKDGRIQVNRPGRERTPPSDDPKTGVKSKDVVISPEDGISARLFLPNITNPDKKLPLLFYLHGGGFCMLSPYDQQYHNYANFLAAEANAVVVSVDYGLFPDRPIPACYDDSWAALQWVASHATGNGPDPWLNEYADFNRVFIGGDSAGGNITHTLLFRVGTIGLPGAKVVGGVLSHPYFGGTEDDEIWLYMCPTNKGLDDPRMNPGVEDLAKLGCERVLIYVAEKDHLLEPGKAYCERLKKSGFRGTVELVENKGEEHCFHLHNLAYDKAVEAVKKFASFINQD